MRNKLCALLCALIMITITTAANGQGQPDEVVRTRTRVVFIHTLVRDKKTRVPVTDLKIENFRVMDNGRPRDLSYFNHDGLGRARPAALVIVLDLCTSAALYLEKPEVMEHIIKALEKLQPGDEVAVVQTWYEPLAGHLNFELRSKMVEGLTRDRAKTAAALRSVQQFAKENLPKVKLFFSLKEAYKATWKDSVLQGITMAGGAQPGPPFTVSVAPDFEYMIDKAPLLATTEYPNSQVMLLEVTDGFEAESYGKTKEIAHRLIGAGVTINGLVMAKDFLGVATEITGRILAPLMGARFHSVSYYSQQTGGEMATVRSPEEFASAVERIISGVAARYSLGFTLGEGDKDDGRLHQLQVKVKGRDARGKERKFVVMARQGYYISAETLSPTRTASAPNRFTNLSVPNEKR